MHQQNIIQLVLFLIVFDCFFIKKNVLKNFYENCCSGCYNIKKSPKGVTATAPSLETKNFNEITP